MKTCAKKRLFIIGAAVLILLILFGFYPMRIHGETPVSNASKVCVNVTVWKSLVLGTKTSGSFMLVRSNGTEEIYRTVSAMPHASSSSAWYLTGLRYDEGGNAYEFADCLTDRSCRKVVFRDNGDLYYGPADEIPEDFIEFFEK